MPQCHEQAPLCQDSERFMNDVTRDIIVSRLNGIVSNQKTLMLVNIMILYAFPLTSLAEKCKNMVFFLNLYTTIKAMFLENAY